MRITDQDQANLETARRDSSGFNVEDQTQEELAEEQLAETIVRYLQPKRFRLTTEKQLQADLAQCLTDGGFDAIREVRLDSENIIDVMVGSIGIECKIKGQRKAIYRQCQRYAAYPQIKALILATNAAMGLPPELAGKPFYCLDLGRAWL